MDGNVSNNGQDVYFLSSLTKVTISQTSSPAGWAGGAGKGVESTEMGNGSSEMTSVKRSAQLTFLGLLLRSRARALIPTEDVWSLCSLDVYFVVVIKKSKVPVPAKGA